MKKLSIREAADILGMTPHTLRYYEKVGLIQVGRRGSIRHYDEEDIRWLQYIKALKDIGFSLEEIKAYAQLKTDDTATLSERKTLLMKQRSKIDRQIQLLKITRETIDEKIRCIEKREEDDEN